MTPQRTVALLVSSAVLALPLSALTVPADAATTHFSSCAKLHKKYPHGVGKSHAKDKTKGDPVTDFKPSTKTYKAVIKHNKGLDRDHDGIACEAH